MIATAVAAAALGERVCRGREGGCPSRWLAVLVGMLLLHVVSFTGSLLGALPGMGAAGTIVSGLGALIKIARVLLRRGRLDHLPVRHGPHCTRIRGGNAGASSGIILIYICNNTQHMHPYYC